MLLLFAKPAYAASLPPGFEDQPVVNVEAPTTIAFTPDDRMLVTSQQGRLQVYDQSGKPIANPALDITGRTCSDGERGLLGVTVDPDFGTNNYIYVYYTFRGSGGCVNRTSRFTLPESNDIDSAREFVLVDNIPSSGVRHNGGGLHFGADGYLYISVGDGGEGGAPAQDLGSLLGKILRVNKADGTAPSSNPYASSGVACNTAGGAGDGRQCQEIFASGLRNPFRFAFKPGTDEFFVNDVGENTWEEIDRGQAGANYGWPSREGPCSTGSTTNCGPSDYADPIYAYPHSSGCSSITGGAFVPNGVWPAEYGGSYFFADFVCGKIFKLTPQSGGGFTSTEFASDLGGSGPVAIAFGPHNGDQVLYYTTYAEGGQVRLVAHTGNGNNNDNGDNDSDDGDNNDEDDFVEEVTVDEDADSASDDKGGVLAESGLDPDEQAPVSEPQGDVVDEVATEGPLPNTGGVPLTTGASLALPVIFGIILLAVGLAVGWHGRR